MKWQKVKKFISICLTASLMATTQSYIVSAATVTKDLALEENNEVSFGVVSDTHVGPNKIKEQNRLKKAFNFFSENELDGVAVVGDLTDSGAKEQYDVFKQIKDSELSIPLIASMGNHEGNTADGFTEATGNKPNDNKVINGYHFITVSPGSGSVDESTGKGSTQGGGNYSYALDWLKNQLDEAVKEDPTKPIFVFFHHPIKDTFYVSNEWHGSGLEEIFKAYPQVVSFSGHIHSPNNMPTSIWQDGGYTAVNTVTLSYMEMESGMVYGTIPPNASDIAQGMIIEAEGSKVTIKNYDFLSNQYIPQTWTFDVTESLPYTNERADKSSAPSFDASAKVNVSEITDSSAKIEFDQAKVSENTVGDIVHSYKYDFINKATNEVDKSFKTWSNYYLLPMPATISQIANGLKANTEYELRIYAINAYGKMSEGYISNTFKTLKNEDSEPPTFDEMREGVSNADLIDVDFNDGKIEDHSPEGNEFGGSNGSNIVMDNDLGKYVATFTGKTSEAFYTPWTMEQYDKIKDSMTIETTFKVEKFSGSYVNLFGNMESAGIGFEIYPNSEDSDKADLSAWVHINGYKVPRVNGVLKYGEWNHSVVTYDGSKVKLYLNGELIDSVSASGDITVPGEASRYYVIGGDSGVNTGIQSPFVGSVSSCRLYSQALSSKKINMLANKELNSLDKVKPIIEIEEEPAKTAKIGSEYTIPAAKSADNSSVVNMNLTILNPDNEVEFSTGYNSIDIEKMVVSPEKSGKYTLIYSAKDKAGNVIELSYEVQVESIDKEELNKIIASANEILKDEEKYLSAGIETLKDAVSLAEGVSGNKDALESEVNEALNKVDLSMKALKVKASKDELKETVENAKIIDLSNYTEESVEAFEEALAKSEEILKDENLSSQEQNKIDEAVNSLKDTIEKLEEKKITEDDNKKPVEDDDKKTAEDDNKKPVEDNNNKSDNNSGNKTSTSSSNKSSSNTSKVKTQDNMNIVIPALLMVISFSAICIISLSKKKKELK
ncbi:MAG: LamG-like jellyroll fold domain-containing protein [Clostridium sp.]